MDKNESLDLYYKGRDAWNTWAKEMLVHRDIDPSKGNNLANHNWFTGAAADFSEHTFQTDPDFSDFLFPGEAVFTATKFAKEASFEGATFSGYACFEDAAFNSGAAFRGATFSGEALFRGATFSGDAEFWEAGFSGMAWFENATFSGKSEFWNAKFSGGVGFLGAMFSGETGFWEVMFSGITSFEGAMFSGEVGFRGAMFSGEADFGRAKFGGRLGFEGATFRGNAGFNQAIFESIADFSGTTFQKEATFVAINGQSAFTLQEARFSVVPDFRQAHFEEAPQLDDVRFNHSEPRLLSGQESANIKKDVTARWRALKRLALQAQDHERELIFLAEEIKSLRGVRDWPLPNPLMFRKGEPICWPGGGRYWAGLFYQWFSDFGRSMFRPFLCWVILTFAFWLIYFSQHSVVLNQSGKFEKIPITTPVNCEPHLDALYISIHKGLVIPGLGRSETLSQNYACLYGAGKENIPYTVMFAGLAQTIISAVLIFLFLLALRNYFRIK